MARLTKQGHVAKEGSSRVVEKVNLVEKFSLFHDYWSPRIAGELNNSYVKLAKFKGPFMWHHHKNEDELFLVFRGQLTIKLRDGDVKLSEGEFVVVPKGVEHLPEAKEEAHVVMLELKSTVNTGNVENEKTVRALLRV